MISSQVFDDDLKVGESGLCDIMSRCEKDAQARQENHDVKLKNHLKCTTGSQKPPSIETLIKTDWGDDDHPAFESVLGWIRHFQGKHVEAVDSGGAEVLKTVDECIASLSALSDKCRGTTDEGEEMEEEGMTGQ